MNCCGVVDGVADVFDIVTKTMRSKRYAMLGFPQTYPGLGTPTDSGTCAGNLD